MGDPGRDRPALELFAEAVAPHFQNRLDRLARSEEQARTLRERLHARMGEALEEASAWHAAEQATRSG